MQPISFHGKRFGIVAVAGLLGWMTLDIRADAAEPAAGSAMRIELGNDVHMELVWIPPGTFTMGSPAHETGHTDSEEPQSRVTITEGFWLGKFPVTQAQYQALTGHNRAYFKQSGLDAPVECVTWFDAKDFCEKLKKKLPPELRGGLVRLPTNAEWEYACRAGTTTALYNGHNLSSKNAACAYLNEIAWYAANSENQTHPVGRKKPNAWGLHDMLGNVWEWCEDSADSYTNKDQTDPVGGKRVRARTKRGGAWINRAENVRSASRQSSSGFPIGIYPDAFGADLGFRVLVRPPLSPTAARRKSIPLSSRRSDDSNGEVLRESAYERVARETFQRKMNELPRVEVHTAWHDDIFSRIDLSRTLTEIESKRHVAFVFRTPEDVATRWFGLLLVPPHGGAKQEFGICPVKRVGPAKATGGLQAKVWIAPADGRVLDGQSNVLSLPDDAENAGSVNDLYLQYRVDGRSLKPQTDYVVWIYLDYGLKPIMTVSVLMHSVLSVRKDYGFTKFFASPRYYGSMTKRTKQARKAESLMEQGKKRMTEGDYERADELLMRSLELTREIYGQDNYRTPLILLRLAYCNVLLGNEDKALFFAKAALAIQNKMYEPDYIGIAVSLRNMLNVLEIRKQYEDADVLYKQMLSIYEKSLGRNHPLTIRNHVRHMYMLQQTGSSSEAERASQQLLAYGADYRETVSALNMYFNSFAQEEKYAEAERAFKQLLTYDTGHRETVAILKLCAEALNRQGKQAEAVPVLQRALAIQEKHFGNHHAELADTLSFLAIAYYEMDSPDQSEILLRRVLTIAESNKGAISSRYVVTVVNNLAFALMKQGKNAQAMSHFEQALAIRDAMRDPDPDDLMLNLEKLVELSRLTGDPEAAGRYEERLNTMRNPTPPKQ